MTIGIAVMMFASSSCNDGVEPPGDVGSNTDTAGAGADATNPTDADDAAVDWGVNLDVVDGDNQNVDPTVDGTDDWGSTGDGDNDRGSTVDGTNEGDTSAGDTSSELGDLGSTDAGDGHDPDAPDSEDAPPEEHFANIDILYVEPWGAGHLYPRATSVDSDPSFDRVICQTPFHGDVELFPDGTEFRVELFFPIEEYPVGDYTFLAYLGDVLVHTQVVSLQIGLPSVTQPVPFDEVVSIPLRVTEQTFDIVWPDDPMATQYEASLHSQSLGLDAIELWCQTNDTPNLSYQPGLSGNGRCDGRVAPALQFNHWYNLSATSMEPDVRVTTMWYLFWVPDGSEPKAGFPIIFGTRISALYENETLLTYLTANAFAVDYDDIWGPTTVSVLTPLEDARLPMWRPEDTIGYELHDVLNDALTPVPQGPFRFTVQDGEGNETTLTHLYVQDPPVFTDPAPSYGMPWILDVVEGLNVSCEETATGAGYDFFLSRGFADSFWGREGLWHDYFGSTPSGTLTGVPDLFPQMHYELESYSSFAGNETSVAQAFYFAPGGLPAIYEAHVTAEQEYVPGADDQSAIHVELSALDVDGTLEDAIVCLPEAESCSMGRYDALLTLADAATGTFSGEIDASEMDSVVGEYQLMVFDNGGNSRSLDVTMDFDLMEQIWPPLISGLAVTTLDTGFDFEFSSTPYPEDTLKVTVHLSDVLIWESERMQASEIRYLGPALETGQRYTVELFYQFWMADDRARLFNEARMRYQLEYQP